MSEFISPRQEIYDGAERNAKKVGILMTFMKQLEGWTFGPERADCAMNHIRIVLSGARCGAELGGDEGLFCLYFEGHKDACSPNDILDPEHGFYPDVSK